MARRLAWVPKESLERLGPIPDSIEVTTWPDEPLRDPRLTEVAFLVVPLGVNFVEIVPKASSLEVVQTLTAGVDQYLPHVPVHVTVCSTRGSGDVPVSEWVCAAVLAAFKSFVPFYEQQRSARWARYPTTLAEGATILLLGYGSIARAVEARLAPFGCRFFRIARRAREGVEGFDALARFLPETDALVVLLPLTDATRHVVDARALSQLRDGAVVVNPSRGAIVEPAALRRELESGRLRAVLDVTEPEPLPADDPLWRAPGLLITPHIAGVTPEGPARNYPFIGEQLRRYALGQPLENVVAEGY